MMILEHKHVRLSMKADQPNGTVELLAAVFGNVDRQGEVIAPGAFTNLDAFARDGWLTVNHDSTGLGLASIESATQDDVGLRVTAAWHTTPEAESVRTIVRERLERGKSVKASIGYRVLDESAETRGDQVIRVLNAIELHEVSIVNLPANPLTEVSHIKQWACDYETAYLALKEGRVLSARNRERLEKLTQRLRETADEVDALLRDAEPEVKKAARSDAARWNELALVEELKFMALCAAGGEE